MKTIEEAASIYAEPIASDLSHKSMDDLNVCDLEDYIADSFKEGVVFSQGFYPIERDQYAEIDLNQKEELERNMPILVKYLDEYGDTYYDVFAEYYPTLEDPIYTHWRPVNLK